jgi:hypothetical protein
MINGVGPYLSVYNHRVCEAFKRNVAEIQQKLGHHALALADIVVDLGANKVIKDRAGFDRDPAALVMTWGQYV